MLKVSGKAIFILLILFSSFSLSGQEKTARKIAEESVTKGSPDAAIKFVSEQVEKFTSQSEKRALYAYLASLQETRALFAEASKSYAKAAGIGGGNAEGMPKKTNEQLVIDSVRCALSGGDYDTAFAYLNSAVRNSKNPEITAKIKLYEQWAVLCSANKSADLSESVTLLKTYLNLDSMKSVRQSVLLTLWYLTADSQYSSMLSKEYPKSMEAGIVNGTVMILPAPFWYFTPRTDSVSEATSPSAEKIIVAEKEDAKEKESPAKQTVTESSKKEDAKPAVTQTESKTENKTEVTAEVKSDSVKLQLGLFREKANAQAFVQKVKEKNFSAYIKEERKPSGMIYFAVIVDENGDTDMSTKLKMAGFESYHYSE